MARSRRGSTFFSPIRRKTRFERFKDFLWQPETKQFLGRTGSGWAIILFFYLCLYLFLAGFFAACMFGLNSTLDDHMPKYMLDDSPIGQTPGLTFRPVQSNVDLTGVSLITFNSSNPSTWKDWIKQIKKELEPYINDSTSVECDQNETTSKEMACKFNLRQLGTICNKDNNFGYDAGEPCFLLRLNKIIGWKPEPFKNANEQKLEDYIADRDTPFNYNPNYVGISCSSYKKKDKLLVGNVTFYPNEGFHVKHFPYWNQRNYHSPLVMVQFKGMKRNEVIKVECKAWAQNVEHNRPKKRGYIRFEVKIVEDE